MQSVLNQTIAELEYILIDGKSSDNTLNIINQVIANYPKVEFKVISEPDEGIYFAMNKGLNLATGQIIGILNSDDVYQNNQVLENIINEFEKSKVDAVYGDLVYTDTNDLNKIVRYWKSGTYSKNSFKFGWMPPHPTFFVKKELYDKFGLFDTRLKSAADYEIMLRMIFKHKARIGYISKILVRMRQGGMSNKSTKNRINANLEDRKAWGFNQLSPFFFTLWLKPLRKLTQFIFIQSKLKNTD